MSLVGNTAPNFTLPNTSREAISLSNLRGRKVVVAFFPAAFTGVCEKELCTFRDSLASFNDLSAEILAISVDSPFSNGSFARKNDINFHVLSDYSRSTTQAYGVALDNFAGMAGYTAAQRSVFVIDSEGVVSWAWIAPNPGVEPNYGDVKNAVEAAN